jgi:hypothetical protein
MLAAPLNKALLRPRCYPPGERVRGKNWLFVGSDDHAQTTANLLSIVATAKLHDLKPEEYARHILRVLPHRPRERYLELAPKSWPATRAQFDRAQFEVEHGPLTVRRPRPRQDLGRAGQLRERVRIQQRHAAPLRRARRPRDAARSAPD